MQRRFIQTLVINDIGLARDIMNGLVQQNGEYQFDVYETKNDQGWVTQVKIEIYKNECI